jgi:hypothetical protein
MRQDYLQGYTHVTNTDAVAGDFPFQKKYPRHYEIRPLLDLGSTAYKRFLFIYMWPNKHA